MKTVLKNAAALASGAVFGLGLSIAQMTDPRKVQAFLDVAGDWDASLMLVLGGAVLTAALGFRLVLGRGQPLWGSHFHLSALRQVDAPLLGGSALFGVGWALAGYCPGPAIASLATAPLSGSAEALWLVPAMLAGAGLRRWQTARRSDAGLAALDAAG
ncbi:MAG TPA: YeeE/YedE family protein [Burkholderiaceae bacterium]|nr:YeeE/YedE family protein [Burkholderiaceae bacterium]